MVYGDMFSGDVLSKVEDTDKLKFRNMIDMLDIAAIRQSRADYIILHKNIVTEMLPLVANRVGPICKPVEYLAPFYQRVFGPIVFEDNNIIVFKINNAKSG